MMFENQTFLLSELDSGETTSISSSGSMRFLYSGRSNRVQNKCSGSGKLQKSIVESVEKNICRRVNLGQACRDGLKDIVRKLLRNNLTTLNTVDRDGFAPLHYATRSNHADIVRLLLEAGAEVNVRGSVDIQRISPLICGAKFNAVESCRILIRAGADVTIKNCYGQSALHQAARRGHDKIMELLLKEGKMDVNVLDNDNTTALHIAAQIGCKSVVESLILRGADLTTKDNDGYTAFHLASRENNSEVLKTLLLTASNLNMSTASLLDSPDNYGNSCLHLSVRNGHCCASKVCLDNGASCSVWQASLQTPLHLAAISGNLCIVKLLVNKNTDINAEDGDGMTAVLRASLEGHVDIVEYLLDKGAPLVSSPEMTIPTPLLCAVERGQNKTIEYLFSRGASLDQRDVHWRNCLHIAAACADPQTVKVILKNGGQKSVNDKDSYGKTPLHYTAGRCKYVCEIVSLLVTAGANLTARDNDERIPLHFAADSGIVGSVKSLLGACPESINESDNRSMTALHIAAANGHKDVCRLLLEKGAEVDYRDDSRLTPLFHVVMHGCPSTVKVLLEFGADIDTRDKLKKTPLIMAAQDGQVDVFKTLLQYGADLTVNCNKGWNVLDAALHNNQINICREIIKHERWKDVMTCTKYDNVSPMKRLIEKFPIIAMTVMNKCIQQSSVVDSDVNYAVEYDFQFLCPDPDDERDTKGERYFGPKVMLMHGREDLLRHPLTKTLMATKWRSVGVNFFYLGALIYTVFVATYSHYMFCMHHFEQVHNGKHNSTGNTCNRNILYAQEISLVIMAAMNLLYECYQFYTERCNYFDIANIFQVCTFVCALITVLPPDGNSTFHTETKWSAGVIGVLLAYLTLLLYLQCLFSAGIYVTMLFEVLKSLLQVFAMFFILMVGFGLVFMCLMNGSVPFHVLDLSIFKVIAMTIGEVEYSRYFVDEQAWRERPNREVLSRLIFMIFCLLMPIALMNLLIGLAVGDIESVQEHAELKMMATEIETVYEFEDKIPLVIRRRMHKPQLLIFPNKPKQLIGAAKKYLGWIGSIQAMDNSEDGMQPISSQMACMRDTLKTHGQRINNISSQLQVHRELLEYIAEALGNKPKKYKSEIEEKSEIGEESEIEETSEIVDNTSADTILMKL